MAQKVKQGKASMGQSLHSVRVMAQKVEHACETKYLSFYFFFLIVFMLVLVMCMIVPFLVFVIDDRCASQVLFFQDALTL
jgi:hypothetical protein